MLNSRLNLYVPPQIQDTNGSLVAAVIPWLVFLLFFPFLGSSSTISSSQNVWNFLQYSPALQKSLS